MNYPPRNPVETTRNYRRYRSGATAGGPSATLDFIGTRVGVSFAARADTTGDFQAVSEIVWFDVAAYGGFVDIAVQDRMLEIERNVGFVVTDVQDDTRRCMVTMKGQSRPRGV